MLPSVMRDKVADILSRSSCKNERAIDVTTNDVALDLINQVYSNKDDVALFWLISSFLDKSGVSDPVEYAKSITSNKSHDYAGTVDAMANFKLCANFGIKPSAGIVTRLCDKVSRIRTLSSIGDDERKVKDESIRDTCIDAANYAAILWLWLTEEELINFESEIGE